MTRRILGGAVTTLLVVAALGLGSWFVFSQVSDATLVTFRTGSMTPAMPQGAVAVTLPASAAELEPGDVVTLRRVGEQLPVTHRVVEVRTPAPMAANAADLRAAAPDSETGPPTGGPGEPPDPDARELVLKGDANAAEDRLPYVTTDARRVVFSIPAVGNGLMLLQTPLGMGVLILFTGALVTWAFWPSRASRAGRAAAPEAVVGPARVPEPAIPTTKS